MKYRAIYSKETELIVANKTAFLERQVFTLACRIKAGALMSVI
jgi:hypothetical protein